MNEKILLGLSLLKSTTAIECLGFCTYAADFDETCDDRGLKNVEKMIPFGVNHGDTQLPTEDDHCFGPVPVNTQYQVFGQEYDSSNIYISANGNVQFGACNPAYTGSAPPLSISGFDADIDMTLHGNWYFRMLTDQYGLGNATEFIQTGAAAAAGFFAIDAFIITWEGVASKGQSAPANDRKNTFQMVVATDGGAVFANTQYGSIEWTQDSNTILNDGGDECLGGEPGTATVNPCPSSGCTGDNQPYVTIIPQNVEDSRGNAEFRGQYCYSITEPIDFVSGPPPKEFPDWWMPSQNYTFSSLPGGILEALPTLTFPEILDHGCQCRKIVEKFSFQVDRNYPEDGGFDNVCYNWHQARQCLYLVDGKCEGMEDRDLEHKMIAGEGCEFQKTEDEFLSPENICRKHACKVDLKFYRKMLSKHEETSFSLKTGDQESCQFNCRQTNDCPVSERQRYPPTHCCGDAPKLFKYTPELKTCSTMTSELIKPDIAACYNQTLDLVLVVDTAGNNATELETLKTFLKEFITLIGIYPESDNFGGKIKVAVTGTSARVGGFTSNLLEIKNNIDLLPSADRNIGRGLEYANSIHAEARQGVRFVSLVVTHGISSDAFLSQANLLQNKGEVYAIGIGSEVDQSELDQISSEVSGLFTNAKYSHPININQVGFFIGRRICATIAKCSNTVKDVVFVVEKSSQVGEANFEKAKDFIRDFSAAMTITPQGNRFAVITFATNLLDEPLEFNKKSWQLDHVLDNMIFEGEDGHSGFEQAVDTAMFLEGRRNVTRDVIIISRNHAGPHNFYKPRNTNVWNIGIPGFELAQANGDFSASYNSLSDITNDLGPQVCSTAIEACRDRQIDLTFVVDGSGSVSDEEFYQNMQWLRDLFLDLHVSEAGIHIALTQFGGANDQILEFPFTYDKEVILNHIDDMTNVRGGTHTGKAMAHAWNDVMNGFGRSGAKKVMVVITDGKAQDDTEPISDALQSFGIPVFGIGIGGAVRWSDIKKISTDVERLYDEFGTRIANPRFYNMKANYENMGMLTAMFGVELCEHNL